MKYKKIKLSIVFLLGLGLTGLQAQETVLSTGGNASGSGGSVSYSVGQIVYTTTAGTNGFMAQGVQQPYEISIVTEIKEAKGIVLNCSAYPNPAIDFVKLKIEKYKIENLIYQIYDIDGKLLENKKIESNEMNIVMSNLIPATYFLKVIDNNKEKEIITFKIIKN
ncbi:MAG: T9SS type A sorting domain-containing protein [Bacteroidota bacterium]